MPETKTVLVFPCGSEIGLELGRALKYSRHFRLLGASSVRDHGDFAYREMIERLPRVEEPAFFDAFAAALERHGVDFVFPAHDEVLTRLAEWMPGRGWADRLIAPEAEVCRLCRSKGAAYRFFSGKMPIPRLYSPDELATAVFPLFMKPDAGQGGRGAERVDDAAAAREKLRHSPGDLIMEYLPGFEFTVDCFTDRHGQLLYAGGRTRGRIANGISVASRDAPNPAFRALAEVVNRELSMRGAWFFQLREDAAGVLRLLEVAPRIAGSSGLRRAAGVNLPLLSLYDRMGRDVSIIDNRLAGAESDRAWSSVFRLPVEYDTAYMDLDDTLIVAGQVNPEAARFLFQCLARGKRLVLLTRHAVDPEETLRRHRLAGVFDEVRWLADGERKSDAIQPGPAVFIDDSFAERLEVSRRLGLPVFDPASLEGLMEPLL